MDLPLVLVKTGVLPTDEMHLLTYDASDTVL